MDKKMALWGVGVMVLTFLAVSQGYTQGTPKLNKEGHRWILGTIEKVDKDSFVIKTKEGTSRNFGIKELEKEKIRNPKAGEFLVMEFDEGNQIIDIDRVGSLDMEPTDVSDFHQTVVGEHVNLDSEQKRVTLRVTGRGNKTYQLKESAATKMKSVKPGTVILLELDEENNMVNDFDIQK